jgi:vacuolar-type H+-ATPase subunit I/STV1
MAEEQQLVNTEVRTLRVPLTDEMKAKHLDKMTHLIKEKEKLEKDKSDSNKEFKSQIDDREAQLIKLANEVGSLVSEQEVKCYWSTNDPEPLKMSLRRADNNEIVETKDMELFDPCADQKLLPENASEEVQYEEVKKDLTESIYDDIVKEFEVDGACISCHKDKLRTVLTNHISDKKVIDKIINKLKAGFYDPAHKAKSKKDIQYILVEKDSYKEIQRIIRKILIIHKILDDSNSHKIPENKE